MKMFVAIISAISLFPLGAMAKPYVEPLNFPICYMITPGYRVLDLTYMCGATTNKAVSSPNKAVSSPVFSSRLREVCMSLYNDVQNATTKDEAINAQRGFDYCISHPDESQKIIDKV